MSRSLAREVAMKLAYSRLLGGEDTPAAVLEKSGEAEPLSVEDAAFAEALAAGVEARADELDAVIAAHAIDWSIGRIARVDLSILRIAASTKCCTGTTCPAARPSTRRWSWPSALAAKNPPRLSTASWRRRAGAAAPRRWDEGSVPRFDTSCYTTSAAAVADGAVVADLRAGLTVPPGGRGLRQSDALFQHDRNLPGLLDELFARTGGGGRCARSPPACRPTAAPGSYMPVFLAGKLAATAVAGALGVPLVPVTHQAGHLRAALLGNEALLFAGEFLAVHLSGGTTDLLLVRAGHGRLGEAVPLGASADLHAGQLVDRLGVAMGLAFPCGARFEAPGAAGPGAVAPLPGVRARARLLPLRRGGAGKAPARFRRARAGGGLRRI